MARGATKSTKKAPEPPTDTEDNVTQGLGGIGLGDDPDEGDLFSSDKDEEEEDEEELVLMRSTKSTS
jgi:hypothetical protein